MRLQTDCLRCQKRFTPAGKRGKAAAYCSPLCRNTKPTPCHRCGTTMNARVRSDRPTCWPCKADIAREAQAAKADGKVGRCEHCGDAYAMLNAGKMYCSASCRNIVNMARKRRILKIAFMEVVEFSVLWKRDAGKCGICGDGIDLALARPDPRSASIDHLFPLSLGGEHSYANTRLAHLGCNSSKGARLTA